MVTKKTAKKSATKTSAAKPVVKKPAAKKTTKPVAAKTTVKPVVKEVKHESTTKTKREKKNPWQRLLWAVVGLALAVAAVVATEMTMNYRPKDGNYQYLESNNGLVQNIGYREEKTADGDMILFLKNMNDKPVKVRFEVIFYDKDGNNLETFVKSGGFRPEMYIYAYDSFIDKDQEVIGYIDADWMPMGYDTYKFKIEEDIGIYAEENDALFLNRDAEFTKDEAVKCSTESGYCAEYTLEGQNGLGYYEVVGLFYDNDKLVSYDASMGEAEDTVGETATASGRLNPDTEHNISSHKIYLNYATRRDSGCGTRAE